MILTLYFLSILNLRTAAINFNIKTELKSFDPILVNPVSMPITASIYEGLFRIDKNGSITYGLADRYIIDANSMIIYIRENASWPDGTDIEAKDFIFAFKRLLDEISPHSYIYYCIKNAEEYSKGKVEFEEVLFKELNNKTIKITFTSNVEEPLKIFGPILSFTPLSPINEKNYLENLNKLEIDKVWESGPYLISEINSNKIKMIRNDYYYKKLLITQINAFIINDTNTAISLFKLGELNFLNLIPLEKLIINDLKAIHSYNRNSKVTYIEFNTKKDYLNHKFREIICKSIDRKLLCEKIIRNNSIPAKSIVPVDYPGKTSKFRSDYKLNLFEEDYKLKLNTNKVLKILCTNGENQIETAQYIQEELLKKLNIKSEIVQVLPSLKSSIVNLGDFDLSISTWAIDYYGPPFDFLNIYCSNSLNNNTSWKNEKFDFLMNKALNSFLTKDKFDFLAKAEEFLFDSEEDSFPVAPLYFGKNYYAIKGNVKGIEVYTGAGSPNFRDAYESE